MNIRSQKGAAIVEFAVILPLLLLIIFGIVEFGFIFYNQAILTNWGRSSIADTKRITPLLAL